MNVRDKRRILCLVCGDMDANCTVCEGLRAGHFSKQERVSEARQWIVDNLTQEKDGQTRIVIPSSPPAFEKMVADIMVYARETGGGEPDGSPDPPPNVRFLMIDWEE